MRTITSHATAQGTREYQEDRSFINATEDGLLIAIFDGHGGDQGAEYLHTNLPYVFNDLGNDPDFPTILEKMKHLFAVLAIMTNTMVAGSTASIVFIPSSLDRAYVGVVGDSPVIIRNADGDLWKSPEHNVRANPTEVAAAKARGGVIVNGYLFGHKVKGFNPPGLQLTRALGDVELDDVLSREPEIFEIPLAKNSFVLVASDGLLDPQHESSEAAQAIVMAVDKGATAGNLVKMAIDKPTHDNASAVLVRIVE